MDFLKNRIGGVHYKRLKWLKAWKEKPVILDKYEDFLTYKFWRGYKKKIL